jgi:hypothetical protein
MLYTNKVSVLKKCRFSGKCTTMDVLQRGVQKIKRCPHKKRFKLMIQSSTNIKENENEGGKFGKFRQFAFTFT